MRTEITRPEGLLSFRGFELDLLKKRHVMGIINVTPDSFSDGGAFLDRDKAVEQGIRMAQDGADIIDVGGESTRPGAQPVSDGEEIERIIPVIEAIVGQVDIPISVDTYKPAVARRAITAGASIINNIMGSNLEKEMAAAAAEFDVPLVLMHIKGTPRSMQVNPVYEDVLGEIIATLGKSIADAERYGVDPHKIIVDPGIGFGKTVRHNLEILKRLRELEVLGKPILVGPSRKSFIGATLGIPDPQERLMGTAAAVAVAIEGGADIVRVHDVKEIVQVVRLMNEIKA